MWKWRLENKEISSTSQEIFEEKQEIKNGIFKFITLLQYLLQFDNSMEHSLKFTDSQ
jgi:hypothetical protein